MGIVIGWKANIEIIVGSTALKYHGIIDEAKDLDIWGLDKNRQDCDYTQMPKEILDIIPNEKGYATPEAILTIKMSHLAWDIKWIKTKRHILMLKNMGFKFIPELYFKLKKHWELIHGNKDFLSLVKNKDDFFNDFVDYKYDHDYLHELVSFPEKPMYTRCLQVNEDVLICRDKFNLMDLEDQIRMFREEVTVIAVERWLVHGKESWYSAYGLALQKTITNLTKNWANDFIIFNLEHFAKPKYEYFKNILEELNMSNKVDLTPFKEILENAEDKSLDLDELIFDMANGYYTPIGVEFPTEEDGDWSQRREEHKRRKAEAGYEHIENEGGGEGGAEYCYGIFKLNGKIYKAEYSYMSHQGYDYDDIVNTLEEVHPVEKTITVYE